MSVNPRKRKVATKVAPPPASDSDDELGDGLGDGLLEGILSHSEDDEEEEEEEEEEEDDDDDETDASSIIEGLSDDEDDEDDEDDIREQMRNLKTSDGPFKRKPGQQTHEMDLDADDDADDEELKPNYTVQTDANGNERYVYKEIDPVYESDDSDAEQTNTIGNIDLKYYDEYPHIGYDINGKRIMRPAKGEALDALLDSIDIPKGWTGLTDPTTGKPLNLTDEELSVLKKVTRNEVIEEGYDPYPEMIAYFSGVNQEIMPLSAAPEPKRRFIPSKHEAKRVMKIVKAIREGRIAPYKAPEEDEEEDQFSFDVWADEKPRPDNSMHIAAPKLPPPGYEASYHPPPEYLPDKAEEEAWLAQDEEDREREFLPKNYEALRKVPGYETFVKERFERSLDLYLAPRIRRNRLNIDPESLLPKLPDPEDLKPFPTTCAAIFRGQEGRVRSVSVDPLGIFVASGGDDGYVRIWEMLTGRQVWNARLSSEEAVDAVAWRPVQEASILAAAAGEHVYLIIPFQILSPDTEQHSRDLLDAGWGYASSKSHPATAGETPKTPPGVWSRPEKKLESKGILIQIEVRSAIKTLSWHRRGDYFCTVSPRGQSSSVAIHTISKHLTQLPFRRLKGIAQTAHFHPHKPLFFVATRNTIRSYDLAKQELVKILTPGAKWISSVAVHPGGDNLLVGTYDRRLLWHDLELSTKPYKTLRFHAAAIRDVAFHPKLPLFADASDDGSCQVFHGKVVGDLMQNAAIVPLKVLRGHRVRQRLGVMGLQWHPREPWMVSAGADGTVRLWC
ncbi:BOP1NT-domain-containing protein [Lizonia empirigonia]|nr:BOP1NT-domain-containing protein [Lizonia empirigonia]